MLTNLLIEQSMVDNAVERLGTLNWSLKYRRKVPNLRNLEENLWENLNIFPRVLFQTFLQFVLKRN